MRKIKVLAVDDSASVTRSLQNYCQQADDMEFAGAAPNGLIALDMIREHEPDVVILDIIMPYLDGFGVLERLASSSQGKMPAVIMLSALSNDEVVMKAMQLGARYFMVKPFEGEQLIRRVREIMSMEEGAMPMTSEIVSPLPSPGKSLDERIASMFITIGIPAHIKGYQYLREGVKQVLMNPDIINRITKELYPNIAKKFETTPSKVERAIRHAIEVAWSRGRIDIINQMFGHCVYTPSDKPTNGEFVALIADKLMYEHSA